MQTTFHNNLSKLANDYDGFIIDLWGVLHDGHKPYPKAIDTLKSLRKLDKKIILLSNAPRRASKAGEVLTKLGFSKDLYDHLLTSGEVAYQSMNQEKTNSNINRSYYYIGPKKDKNILDGLDYRMVTQANDADFAIVTGFDNEKSTLDEKISDITVCIKHDIPLICINPDMEVIRQNGVKMLCAGVIAKEYSNLGGIVNYFGKPYKDVYLKSIELLNINDNDKILAIGDNLHTDIIGANNMNIDSVLVTGGILSTTFENNSTFDKDKLIELFKKESIYPKYVIPSFV